MTKFAKKRWLVEQATTTTTSMNRTGVSRLLSETYRRKTNGTNKSQWMQSRLLTARWKSNISLVSYIIFRSYIQSACIYLSVLLLFLFFPWLFLIIYFVISISMRLKASKDERTLYEEDETTIKSKLREASEENSTKQYLNCLFRHTLVLHTCT